MNFSTPFKRHTVEVLSPAPLPVPTCRHQAQDDAGGTHRRRRHQVLPSSGCQEQTGRRNQVVHWPSEQNLLLQDLRRARQLRDSAEAGLTKLITVNSQMHVKTFFAFHAASYFLICNPFKFLLRRNTISECMAKVPLGILACMLRVKLFYERLVVAHLKKKETRH